MDYIIRLTHASKEKKTYVEILDISSKVIACLWIKTEHIRTTETTLYEAMDHIAAKIMKGKNRQRSLFDPRDLPPVPRSKK